MHPRAGLGAADALLAVEILLGVKSGILQEVGDKVNAIRTTQFIEICGAGGGRVFLRLQRSGWTCLQCLILLLQLDQCLWGRA